ncbi:hypothetical protein Dimus_030381 [Dionaea muscipula]
MDDPFTSVIDHCHCSDSQMDHLNRTQFAREDEFRSASPAPPSPPAAAVGVAISTPLETPHSTKADDTPPAEQYKTPPEEARLFLSSSQEQPQLTATAASAASTFASSSKSEGSISSAVQITEVEVSSVFLNRGSDANAEVNLGFLELKRAEMVEVVEEGKVKVREISPSERRRFRVKEGDCPYDRWLNELRRKKLKTSDAEGRDLRIEGAKISGDVDEGDGNPLRVSPLRRLLPENVHDTEELIMETDNNTEEDGFGEVDEVYSPKKKLEFYEGDDGDYDGNSGISGGTEDVQSGDMGDYDDKGLAVENGEVNDPDLVQRDAGDGEKFSVIVGEMEDENENVHRERCEVVSVTGEEELIWNTDNDAATDNFHGGIKSLLEAVKVLAEQMPYNHIGKVDIFETAKRHGMKFPRPRWWGDGIEEEDV